MKQYRLSRVLAILLAASALSAPSQALETFTSPDWFIDLTDYGYSDFLIYTSGVYPDGGLHEMLSGEWAGAVGYDGIMADQSIAEVSQWLEPSFIYPDWFTNSGYVVIAPISPIGGAPGPPTDSDADGLPEGESTISNGTLEIRIVYDMDDTTTGHPMGVDPTSSSGGSVTSNRYVLRQTYEVKNISGDALTGVRFYQFLHGHPANTEWAGVTGVYDSSPYTGPLSAFRYDITESSVNTGFPDGELSGFQCTDSIGLSFDVVPADWGIGHYRGHGLGKPADTDVEPDADGDGGHYEVERDTLENETLFGPDQVGGAERHDHAVLNDGATVVFETLLTVSSSCVGNSVPTIRPSGLVALSLLMALTSAYALRRRVEC